MAFVVMQVHSNGGCNTEAEATKQSDELHFSNSSAFLVYEPTEP
jgi:hypothetical protein